MKVLFIDACVKDDSRTRYLADYLASKIDGDIKRVKLNDLGLKPLDKNLLIKRDKLINENKLEDEMFKLAIDFKESDIILIASPYWDLSFPSLLKIYFEQINVLNVVFKYGTDNMPHSLCNIKKMYYITTSGGAIINDEYGFGYIKSLFNNFYGVNDIKYIKAECLDIYGADVNKILNDAKKKIDELL